MYKYLISLCILCNIIFAQNNKPIEVILNSLDFSRYPKVDLYATFKSQYADSANKPVRAEEFIERIRHDNKTVKIEEIAAVTELKKSGESELYISLVFDNSQSMVGRINLLEAAAKNFVNGLRKGDYVNIIDFGLGAWGISNSKIKIPESDTPIHAREKIGFSNSKFYLTQRIHTESFTKKTFLYDAILLSLSKLNSSSVLGKKVSIVFSDGKNIGSNTDYGTILSYMKQYDIPIYAIDLNRYPNDKLKNLAESSGGRYYFVKKPEDLITLYSDILKLLQNQYRITYAYPNENVNKSNYLISLDLKNLPRKKVAKRFNIAGEKIGYYNLVYQENTGEEKSSVMLDYLMGFPKSHYHEDVLLMMARYWKNRGNIIKAIGVCDDILRNKNSRNYYNALALQAELLKQIDEFEASKAAYEEVISSDQDVGIKPKAIFDLANTYQAEGNYISALNTYTKLVNKYEGTEWASRGLLKTSELNVSMGDLDAATNNLNKIMREYPDSKSLNLAKFQLAQVLYQKNRVNEAKNQYHDIIDNSDDDNLKVNSMIELLGIYIDSEEYNDAEKLINAKSSIIDNNKDNLTLLKNVITAHLMMNHPTLAAGLFYSLEGSISKILIDDLGVVQNDSSGINYLANGAGIQAPGNISLYNDPDFANKYKTEGNVYQLSGITRKKMAFYFPISNERVNPDNNSEAGIYNYYKNKFNLIHPISKDAASIVKLEVSNPGVYAFLKEKPIIFKLFNVYFDYAKYNIRKDAEKNLFSLIDYLKSNPFIKMEIAGHTDNVGTPEYNLNLSLKRAEAIKNFLMKKGIRENRLTARGYGSQYPLVDNSTESNRQKNRRSEFIVLQNSENKGNLAGEAVKRFSVEIRNFNSMQEAYKLNKFFNKRKFKTSVTISRVKNKTVFKVLLGIFPTEDEANKAVNKFTAEFKNYQPKIVRIR